jgi:hypothetical protein
MWKVNQAFLSKTEARLIKKCFSNTTLSPVPISVRELGRYGNSGARLLLGVLSSRMPLVVKIHDKVKIQKEHQAMKRVANFFRDVNLPAEPAYYGDKGALLYWHQGAGAESQLCSSNELRDIVFDYDEPNRLFRHSDNDIVALLRKVWHCCGAARDSAKKAPFNYNDEYKRYMRKEAAEAVLSCIVGRNRDKQDMLFMGGEVSNPLLFINAKCLQQQYFGKIGPVHGDLHANNVIVDGSGSVHLIDFAWATSRRHVLVDYVLMECSLRFLLFPHHVDPIEQLEVDTILLKPDGGKRLAGWDWDSPLANYYRRLGIVVDEIRTQARRFQSDSSDRSFLEYLAAQFLVLFGQMSYRDYNRLIAVRALGLIARELITSNFGS